MYTLGRQPPTLVPAYDAIAPFSDPFADIAAAVMPISVPAMLRHAEFFSIADETLRSAYNRMAAYFLTDLKLTGDLGEDEKKTQKEYLVKRAKVIQFGHEAGLSFLTYGNQYTSVFPPVIRYVVCPSQLKTGPRAGHACGARWRFAEFNTHPIFSYSWKSGIYGRCPNCDYSGVFHDKNRPPHDEIDDAKPLILISWNPHDIRIVWNEFTRKAEAFDWVIPADVRTDVRMGYNKPLLENTPWEWLMAALGDMNIRFNEDQIHHWREPALAGVRSRGVGIPRAITNYRQIYYARILRRMNEVLALGHVVPMRVISPSNTPGRSGEGDILRTGFMGDVRSRVNRMIANWRADPSSVQFSPIALQFQSLGADARNLIPNDILTQAQDVLLNGSDVPVDFYRLSMTTQNAPVGLRLIEAVWAPYVTGLNALIGFIGNRAQFLLKWPKTGYEFERVTLVDSVEKTQLRVQMAQAGLLSRSTATREVDVDFEEETRQKMLDQRTEQRLQQEFDDENEAFAFSRQMAGLQAGAPPGGVPGAAGPGGAPQQGGPAGSGPAGAGGAQQAGQPGFDPMSLVPQPGTRIDPDEMLSRADQMAQYLLGIPDAQRHGILQQIAKTNSMFHKVVKGQLEEQRSQARSKGQQLVLQQQGAQ